jgi:two-component sensor histidine kinase
VTGIFGLDWAMFALSLFNTTLLLWLGLAVLLNASVRHWGTWLMVVGLFAGASFFISHTAILGQNAGSMAESVNFWWYFGWIALLITSLVWYVAVLWFTGARYRHRFLFPLLNGSFVLLLVTLVFHPLPAYADLIQLNFQHTLMINGVPLMFILFPMFMITAILGSMEALLHPEAARQGIEQLAWEKARPWLLSTSCVLLCVSLLVTTFIAFVWYAAQTQTWWLIELNIVGAFDVLISTLIAAGSILLGQAVVAHEVFTGSRFPRRKFFLRWRSVILFAAGFALLLGWALTAQIPAVYLLLLALLLLLVFQGLAFWQNFTVHDQFNHHLQLSLKSSQMTHLLLKGDHSTFEQAKQLLKMVCTEVLNTERAALIPAGMFAPLAPQLFFPAENTVLPLATLSETDADIISLRSSESGGLCWAIPLWATRGRIGTLLIGAKRDGSLYTQEEIDLARATGERIVDLLATESIIEQLISLQHSRFVDQRVMDLRVRQLLHDEILPLLHTVLLDLNRTPLPETVDAVKTLMDVHRQISDLIHSAALSNSPTSNALDTALHSLIEREFHQEFEHVDWQLDANLPVLPTPISNILLNAAREIVRNAAIHGRGGEAHRPLCLKITATVQNDQLKLTIVDDGIGPHATSGTMRSGNGLALHTTLLAVIGGSLEIIAAGGTHVAIYLPLYHLRQKAFE